MDHPQRLVQRALSEVVDLFGKEEIAGQVSLRYDLVHDPILVDLFRHRFPSTCCSPVPQARSELTSTASFEAGEALCRRRNASP